MSRLLHFGVFSLIVLASVASAQHTATPPLHTGGHRILDSKNRVVRLTSVNWYGFDQKEFVPGGLDLAPLGKIIEQIRLLGVNSVRLPWANETIEKNPTNRALDVMDRVIAALAEARIMVILD